MSMEATNEGNVSRETCWIPDYTANGNILDPCFECTHPANILYSLLKLKSLVAVFYINNGEYGIYVYNCMVLIFVTFPIRLLRGG